MNSLSISSANAPASMVVSVVSHGHGPQVQALLWDLARLSAGTVRRVVLTQNLPEPPPQPPEGGWPFALECRRNEKTAGFGTNHNRALAGATESLVCLLNPDVGLGGADPFAALARAAQAPGVGVAYPEQVDALGQCQDSERELPTPWSLWRRWACGAREQRVEWVNAACLVLPTPVWQQLGGFDEGYFLYCEDVDLCLRLRLAGMALVRAGARVVHAGQRDSHRRWRHLLWHLRSLWRLWRSPVFARGRRLRGPSQGPGATIAAP